jgi:hypothetical protein
MGPQHRRTRQDPLVGDVPHDAQSSSISFCVSSQVFCAPHGWNLPMAANLLSVGDARNVAACQPPKRSEPDRISKARYLSWLSLLPLRLNPMFAGRRSRAD